MSEDDKLTLILMQVGETKGKVGEMASDLVLIKGKMGSVVTRGECTGKHRMLSENLAGSMGEMKEELRRGIAELKKGTGQHFQSITPAMLAAAAAAPAHEMSPAEMESALAARTEERAEKRRKLITWYIGTTALLLGLLGTTGAFVYKMVLTLDRVQTAMASQPSALRREIQQAASKQKVIYLPAPNPGRDDDGTPLRALPKRTPR